MYANSALSSLELLRRAADMGAPGGTRIASYIESVADTLKRSQKFHFGTITTIVDISKNFFHKRMFEGDLKIFGLPFKQCWFDYSDSAGGPFAAILLSHHDDDTINIVPFYHKDPAISHVRGADWSPSLAVGQVHVKDASGDVLDVFSGLRIEGEEVDTKQIEAHTAIFNFSMMLLSCKNITTEKVYPHPKQQKSRKKHGRQPLFTYHTLVIKPTGKRQESIPKHLWENRIHLCRGHFKTYTKEKPLFGHITGRYWWQPSVRGRNRDGIVMKDYQVETA